jgi:outer membrane murein-binding lipoprotein Lpp
MKTNIKKTLTLFAVIATLTTGCQSKDEYKKLADAGNTYTTALDQLLTTASNIKIKATSEKLLQQHQIAVLTVEQYQKISETDEKRLQIINDLIQHNQLLHAYFEKLESLVNSNAPQQTKMEIDGIATNLNSIGKRLQASNLVPQPSLISTATGFVVDSQITGVLREEIQKRHPLILQELTLQEKLLDALGDDVQHDINMIKSLQEYRLVIRPLTKTEPISNEDGWIQIRQQILTMQRRSADFKNASNALGNFKTIYQAYLSGNGNKNDLNRFAKQINTLLASVQTN